MVKRQNIFSLAVTTSLSVMVASSTVCPVSADDLSSKMTPAPWAKKGRTTGSAKAKGASGNSANEAATGETANNEAAANNAAANNNAAAANNVAANNAAAANNNATDNDDGAPFQGLTEGQDNAASSPGNGSASPGDGATAPDGTPSQDSPTASQENPSASPDNTTARDGAPNTAGEQTVEGAREAAAEHYHLANGYLKKWDLPMAQVELEVSIMFDPNLKIAHRDYTIVALFSGHPLRALAEMMMTVGLGDAVPLNQDECKELKTRAAKTHYIKALALARQNKWDDAITEIQWAQSYTPSNPALERSLAFCYASKGDFDAAEREYAKTFQMDPGDAFSHADFAFILSDRGKEQKAENQLSEALKLAPNVAALHVDMGWLAESKGDFGTAETEFRQAIKLCPKQAGLWLHLGRILEHQKQLDEAMSAYQKALALDSSEDEAKDRLTKLQAQLRS